MTTEAESKLQQRVADLEGRVASLEGRLQFALMDVGMLRSRGDIELQASAGHLRGGEAGAQSTHGERPIPTVESKISDPNTVLI